MLSEHKQLHSVQCLRAIAASLVVYHHSIVILKDFSGSKQQAFFHLLDFGAIGVDLFFVISGFIITLIANNYSGGSQGSYFLAKRFVRINPIYYLVSLLFLTVSALGIWLTHENVSFGKAFSSLSDTILILPLLGTRESYSPVLVIGWTLSFEWLFYLLFYCLILLKARNKSLWMSMLIISLVATRYLFEPANFQLQFLTNPILLEFLLGVLICRVYLTAKRIPRPIPVICLSIGLLGYTLLIIFGYPKMWPVLDGSLSMQRFLLWGIPSGFIVAGCILLEKDARLHWLWNNKRLLLIGDASYSIYLTHTTVFLLLIFIYQKTGSPLNGDLTVLLQLLIALLAGIGFYKLVERPLLTAGQKLVFT